MGKRRRGSGFWLLFFDCHALCFYHCSRAVAGPVLGLPEARSCKTVTVTTILHSAESSFGFRMKAFWSPAVCDRGSPCSARCHTDRARRGNFSDGFLALGLWRLPGRGGRKWVDLCQPALWAPCRAYVTFQRADPRGGSPFRAYAQRLGRIRRPKIRCRKTEAAPLSRRGLCRPI